jgi:hypothetical protein
MRSAAATLGVAALALVTAGCGTPGPEGSARGTVEAFLLNCGRDDGPAAMQVLVEPAKAQFDAQPGPAAGCARILGARADGVRVRDVRVDGGLASAHLDTATGPRTLALSFGREGWRIEGAQS